jgi:hypothetical protein
MEDITKKIKKFNNSNKLDNNQVDEKNKNINKDELLEKFDLINKKVYSSDGRQLLRETNFK